jgi:hypothetical protein
MSLDGDISKILNGQESMETTIAIGGVSNEKGGIYASQQ